MGLLTIGGRPLTWGEDLNTAAIPYILEHGIRQFLELYKRGKDYDGYPFTWGDEIESLLIAMDGQKHTVKLSLNAHEILEACTREDPDDIWHPEYGSFMVESTPGTPYTLAGGSLADVEASMRRRYAAVDAVCAKRGLVCVTLVAFPLLGVGDFILQPTKGINGPFADSIFVPDECTNQTHPRFGTLTRNIRLRRGRKVCIQVPMYLDRETLSQTVDPVFKIDRHPMNKLIDCATNGRQVAPQGFGDDDDDDGDATKAPPPQGSSISSSSIPPPNAKASQAAAAASDEGMEHLYTPATDYYYAQYTPKGLRAPSVQQRFLACPCPVPSVLHPCIYMDAMAFGMGCCCLQVTMQMPNLRDATYAYDQLAILSPLFLALTSATPVQKGILCDSDVRWLTIAASVDDRQKAEVPRILKSRYDSVSVFMSSANPHVAVYNDNPIEVHKGFYDRLISEGVDAALARHVAHLFIRDPLVIYDAKIEQLDDTHESDHFDSIQTTNWQTVRFKPPPFNSTIGWRVEFRPMEVQLSAFENAAFSVFVALLTAAIVKYKINFYIPMSLVDINTGRAHIREPCNEHFHFRRDWTAPLSETPDPSQWEAWTLDELFNGSPAKGMTGFVSLVRRYIADEGTPMPALVERYIALVSDRAARRLQTAAEFLRSKVLRHAKYRHDSRVTPEIAFDLVQAAAALARGVIPEGGCSSLLHESDLVGGHHSAVASPAPPSGAAASPSPSRKRSRSSKEDH